MAQRKCRACADWHDLEEPWPVECASHFRAPAAPSSLPRPYVIRDSLPGGVNGMRSMADNRYYDSRSQYLDSLRGKYEIVGDQGLSSRPPPELTGVGKAINEAGKQLGIWE